MQNVPLQVRAWDHSQTTVVPVSINQIVHQKILLWLFRIADGMVPKYAVLMPVELWTVGWFANNITAPDLWIVKS